MRTHIVFAMAIATVCAVFFTWFYTVHEELPRWARAPTSLLLALVAIADGLGALTSGTLIVNECN